MRCWNGTIIEYRCKSKNTGVIESMVYMYMLIIYNGDLHFCNIEQHFYTDYDMMTQLGNTFRSRCSFWRIL